MRQRLSIHTIRDRYLKLIRSPRVPEEVVHQFLVEHPALLPLWFPWQNVVFSKLPLGNQHISDFSFARQNTPGVTWHLIEIERPEYRLFTKSGNPTAKLTHALRQAHDWMTWFIENRDYIVRTFPFVDLVKNYGLWRPEMVVVIGRRSDMSDRDRKLLQRLSEQVRIVSFDRLADEIGSPAAERGKPLRTCSWVNGEIRVLAEMHPRMYYDIDIDPPQLTHPLPSRSKRWATLKSRIRSGRKSGST